MRVALTSATATAVGPYSHGVDSDPFIFCSGQTPVDPATGELRAGSVADRTRQCFTNLFAVLADGGLGPEAVVKVNVFLTDMDDFAEMNQAYAEIFNEPFPARTTVGVASLPLGSDIEIELMARRPPTRRPDAEPANPE